MKKYIRTENGIYKVEEIEKYFLDERQKLFINNTMRIAVKENDVIKQADTIEELCDEFVGLVKSTSSNFIIMTVIAHSLKELKESLKTELNGEVYEGHYDIIYGAIWTSKGLIYVAKMNENGDLELI